MGRPKELTEAERAELVAKGYRRSRFGCRICPIRRVRDRLIGELRAIRESDARSGEWSG